MEQLTHEVKVYLRFNPEDLENPEYVVYAASHSWLAFEDDILVAEHTLAIPTPKDMSHDERIRRAIASYRERLNVEKQKAQDKMDELQKDLAATEQRLLNKISRLQMITHNPDPDGVVEGEVL